MKRNVIIILACVGAFCTLVSCHAHGSAPPPPSARDIPLYPKAQQIQTSSLQDDITVASRLVSYKAEAKSADILSFYEGVLQRDQWITGDQVAQSDLDFYWTKGCPKYHLIIKTTVSSETETAVELKLITELCR